MTSKEIILTWRSSLYKNVSGHTDNNNLLKVRDKFLNEVSNQALVAQDCNPSYLEVCNTKDHGQIVGGSS
jgi:hypothetical protein